MHSIKMTHVLDFNFVMKWLSSLTELQISAVQTHVHSCLMELLIKTTTGIGITRTYFQRRSYALFGKNIIWGVYLNILDKAQLEKIAHYVRTIRDWLNNTL